MNNINKEIFESFAQDSCKEYGITFEALMSKCRRKPYPQARIKLAKSLYAEGFTYAEISRAMKCDHTSVRYMVLDTMRQTRKEKYRAGKE